MKKIIAVLSFLVIALKADVEGDFVDSTDYNVPFAIKNISENDVVDFIINYTYGLKTTIHVPDYDPHGEPHDIGPKRNSASHSLGRIDKAKLTEPGKVHMNTLTLDRVYGAYEYQISGNLPTKIDLAVKDQLPAIQSIRAIKEDGSAGVLIGGTMNDSNKKAYNHAGFAYPDINRQSFIHYLIIPGGDVVQVPEIIEYGGVVTGDQYIIHGDGHVSREDGLPCEKCNPPAGKTTASVDRNGNLVWL